MPPSFFAEAHTCDHQLIANDKRRNAFSARSAFGSQKELTSFLVDPLVTVSVLPAPSVPAAVVAVIATVVVIAPVISAVIAVPIDSAVVAVAITVAIDPVVVVVSATVMVPVSITVVIAVAVGHILLQDLCRCQGRTASNKRRTH